MGMIMFRCPKTGRTIATGIHVAQTSFRASAVFFSRTHCPVCQVVHEWFAKDAWVCNSESVGMTFAAPLGEAATPSGKPKNELAMQY